MKYTNEPSQPSRQEWRFVGELSQPEQRRFARNRRLSDTGRVDLSGGVRIIRNFTDAAGRLDTAYDDLKKFFDENGISVSGGYEIITQNGDNAADDAFKIITAAKSCRIIAGNAEGVRRGIYHLEDLLLGAGGPSLATGEISRTPWVKNRISRCFFGPIKRPPLNRDELLDEVDYYPEEYLNRLAHEGINGLWLTIKFSDLCKTSITPEQGKDAVKRLTKLRGTVDKCLRYGIKTYIFCIEPAAWAGDSQVLQMHPELGGAKYGDMVCFCPFSEISQQYLYESVNSIFKAVPGLGGMINISHGERLTTCLSSVPAIDDNMADCPVCSGKEHWEILHATLSAMEKGMHDAVPEAQLISWLYMPYPQALADWVFEIPNHIPDNVILQFNFESGGTKVQLGKPRIGGDYWLSYTGPCDSFRKIAEAAIASGAQLSAKIQVGCSHEVATIPFVPAPALLYRKYRKMHELGVSSVMQCWYFGNYPGIMNKAAGMLAFENFKSSEEEFLLELALPDWGEHAGDIVEAWMLFAGGYANYPLSNMFQYYGPMHDGVVWPLYLYPAHRRLAPTWKLEFGTSGDAIGECLENHTIGEAVILCREMSEMWNCGVDILKQLRGDFKDNPARLKDIGLAEALGIQFESGYNILRFYALREQLFNADHTMQKSVLDEMAAIVLNEIGRSERLAALCEDDSRLGFHSESEGYKYFPEKLGWRIAMLKSLLAEDFPTARLAVAHGGLDWPVPADTSAYNCGSNVMEECDSFRWKAGSKNNALVFEIECERRGVPDQLFLSINTGNTSYPLLIDLDKSGKIFSGKSVCTAKVTELPDGWNAEITILPAVLDCGAQKSVRLNIVRYVNFTGRAEYCCWPVKKQQMEYRLNLGMYNPQEAGLLILNKITQNKSDKITQFGLQTV
ncbi:MAG: hypothetical protein WCV67_16805 [Victivallaceae bacterium]|jgi:hypothetical protein